MRRALAVLMSAGLVALLGGVSSETASAAPEARSYANCKALNKVYPHGVGKSASVRDRTSGKRVTTFKVSKKVYVLNKLRDRDRDGIACEKR